VQGCAHAVLQATQEIIVPTQGQVELMAYPKDYKYTKEHEWIQVKGNTGLVGITDHAQE